MLAYFILTNILNLWFLFIFLHIFILLFFIIFLIFIVRDFLITLLLNEKFDGISNELRMLLNNFLHSFLFKILEHVFLEVKNNLCSSTNGLTVICSYSE